jgi:hypothetical protein
MTPRDGARPGQRHSVPWCISTGATQGTVKGKRYSPESVQLEENTRHISRTVTKNVILGIFDDLRRQFEERRLVFV